MRKILLLSSLTILVLIVSACASATPMPAPATSVPAANSDVGNSKKNAVPPKPVSSQPTVAPAAAMPSEPAAVNIGQDSSLGSFLVDSKGMTLYIFAKDTPNTSNCSGACTDNWPPLLTNGAPVAGAGVTAGLLGTLTRADGSIQVTYNSLPLYYFAGDKAAGDTNGQGVKNLWSVINPAGISVAPAATAVPAATEVPATPDPSAYPGY
jgi:predicted lipoprotein with Yx(FWY)xxD motif